MEEHREGIPCLNLTELNWEEWSIGWPNLRLLQMISRPRSIFWMILKITISTSHLLKISQVRTDQVTSPKKFVSIVIWTTFPLMKLKTWDWFLADVSSLSISSVLRNGFKIRSWLRIVIVSQLTFGLEWSVKYVPKSWLEEYFSKKSIMISFS
jgi:hypothetical protein